MMKAEPIYCVLLLTAICSLAGCQKQPVLNEETKHSTFESTKQIENKQTPQELAGTPSPSSASPVRQVEKLRDITFKTTQNADGSTTAELVGLQDSYLSYSGANIELQNKVFHMVHLSQGDEKAAANVLLSFNLANREVDVKWSDSLNRGINNPWENVFYGSLWVEKLGEDQLLFLESEMTDKTGRYHLSSFNIATGKITRFREDIWPPAKGYDRLYQVRWNDGLKKLFMQSDLGNVWIYDLRNGNDHVHLHKFPVIPHSTTGYPSLWASPDFERFAHDDESGKVTFYNAEGASLQKITLPDGKYVPSEKVKWNPSGTVAWMEMSKKDDGRVRSYDIDYFNIAPEEIHFFDRNGREIMTVRVKGNNRAVEITGWKDSGVAVLKEFSIKEKKDPGNWGRLEESNATFFLFDLHKKMKRPVAKSEISTFLEKREEDANYFFVKVKDNKLIYSKTATTEAQNSSLNHNVSVNEPRGTISEKSELQLRDDYWRNENARGN